MSVKKNYVYKTVLTGANLLFPLITFPYVARVLGPEGLGSAQFAFTYAQYFSLLASIGIPFYGIKEVAMSRHDKSKLDKTFSELLLISIIATAIVMVVYITSIILVTEFKTNISLYIISSSVLVLGFLNLDWLFSGLEDFKFITLRSVLVKCIALVGLFIFVKKPEDIGWYVGILAFSLTGNFVLNLCFIRNHVKFIFNGLNLKHHVSALLFILSSSFATTIYSTLDSVTLGFISDKIQVGFYAAAIKLAKVSIPVVTSLGAVLVPRIASAIEKNSLWEEQSLLSKSFAFIAFISVPIAFGLFIYSEHLILLFSGKDFIEASISLKYLSGLPIFIGLGYLFGFQILVPRGLNKHLFYSTSIGLIVFLAVNWAITPSLGAQGTAISVLSTEIVVTALYFAYSPKELWNVLPWKEFAKAFLLCSTFFLIKFSSSKFNLEPTLDLIIGILACGFFYTIGQKIMFSNQFVISGTNSLRSQINRWLK